MSDDENRLEPSSDAMVARRLPRPIRVMDPQLTNIQPGGGCVMRLEQGWGYFRRAWLRTFRSSYVASMQATRKGAHNPCPHPVLDPRDLKFHRNQVGYYWEDSDDPFQWRHSLPFARVGFAELLVIGGGLALTAGLFAWLATLMEQPGKLGLLVAAFGAAICSGLIAWFFRNPTRLVPLEPGLVVAPADGKVVEIEECPHDPYIGGPALKIGIFLSIFNAHINRAPLAGRVIAIEYQPGKCLNALRPESARVNERLSVFLESNEQRRGVVVSQITGAIARRIVCWLKPGDMLKAGEPFGMIKLGSRTELLLPLEASLQVCVKVGDKIKAGSSILAKYQDGD